MGVQKEQIKAGDGVTRPKKGDTVGMQYTGWLYDPSQPESKGKQFDSSESRGLFKTKIGEGRVIQGWNDGILRASGQEGLTKGEKATLTITSDYAYGDRGFPGVIPAGAILVFDVELVSIN